MATLVEIVAAVDAFMAAPKRIVGHDSPRQWKDGFTAHERELKYPLQVGGELSGAHLMIVGFPRERSLKFRIGILFPAMVCRLDYTDETHGNSLTGVNLGAVPAEVSGPHYHSWPLNRHFFHAITKPLKLRDATPYLEAGRTFDAILRWFCNDTNIEQLPTNHLIALMRAETLF